MSFLIVKLLIVKSSNLPVVDKADVTWYSETTPFWIKYSLLDSTTYAKPVMIFALFKVSIFLYIKTKLVKACYFYSWVVSYSVKNDT